MKIRIEGHVMKKVIVEIDGIRHRLVHGRDKTSPCYRCSLSNFYDDMVDACVEMILKLKEKNLL